MENPGRAEIDQDKVADAITSEIDRIAQAGNTVARASLTQMNLSGADPEAFRVSFTKALEKAAGREKALTEALDALKQQYASERDRLLKALENTQEVSKALLAAMAVLTPEAPEEAPKAAPVPFKRPRRK